MDINNKLVGFRIKNIRQNLGMTQEEFGNLFDATRSNVSKWERASSLPNKERLKQIAKIGDMTVEELLYENINTEMSVRKEQLNNFNFYKSSKERVVEQEIKLLTPSALSGFFTLGLGFKKSEAKAIEDYENHRKRIRALNDFGMDYINKNYEEDYTYNHFIEDYPDAKPEDFKKYKENEWYIFKSVLDNFWEAFDFSNDKNDLWINKRFKNQINDVLDKVSKKAVEEGKEHYYVNEVVQPFFDQAAKDFKEYISDYIDTED